MLNEEHAETLLAALMDDGRSGYSVAINAEKITMYGRDATMREIIDDAAVHVPDGAGAVLGLRWLHRCESGKINFPVAVLKAATKHEWPLFILGASESVNRKACEIIKEDYPGINLAGNADGFISDDEKFERVAKSGACLVLVALGSPRQELFARRLIDKQEGLFVVGCGGALDVIAGNVKRAPRFMIENNLEWLYRLYLQPSRWRRQLVLVPFFLRLLSARLLGVFSQSGSSVEQR
jgi:N-acetylglucosaminyldiphosphoundecaprenol N-acetyl-beta-D-mannosaminyltransferase